MPRTVPAVALGVILGQLVALMLWWWGFYAFNPPLPLDMNPALARAHPEQLPFMSLLWQAFGQGLGAFLGALWAIRLGREGDLPGWITGGLSFALAVFWMLFFPRPLWFPVFSAILIGGGAYGAVWLSSWTARGAAA
jgi:hypothetical protein